MLDLLPEDVLVQIISRVDDGQTIARAQATCRSVWSRLHTRRAAPCPHAAWLAILRRQALPLAPTRTLSSVLSREEVWEALCAARGFKQLSATRTRGRRPWKEVFVSNICAGAGRGWGYHAISSLNLLESRLPPSP